MQKIWTKKHKDFIKNNAGILKDRELAEKLSEIIGKKISVQAVRKQRQMMGIKKMSGRGKCLVVKDGED